MRMSEVLKSIDDITDEFGMDISVSYSKFYKENGKAFISSFLKFNSVKMACVYMRRAFIRNGLWDELEKKDFNDYVNKFELEDKWKPIMNDSLIIIYNLIKE